MSKLWILTVSLAASFSIADPTMDQQMQINQALINARNRIDFNKVQEQQEQQNRDNQLAIKISEITGIPSWRNIVFTRQARNGNKIDFYTLINLINQFLKDNNHKALNKIQEENIILLGI